VLLVLTASGLALGLFLHVAGAGVAGNAFWSAVGGCGAAYALWAMADALRHGRVGVDVIALLAVGAALAVGELLAAAVIAVMLASGRALEAWAAGRACRDLHALLERAPRTARQYRGHALETVPLDTVMPGDLLLVAPGELVPVDGTRRRRCGGAGRVGTDRRSTPGRTGTQGTRAQRCGECRRPLRPARHGYCRRQHLCRDRAPRVGGRGVPSPVVRLADRYAVWFLLVSMTVAGAAWLMAGAERAVAVLVVATPCPLILAAPVALVSGLSVAARRGVVVKGGGVLERLARCTTLLLDKTGTLTSGRPQVSAIIPAGGQEPAEILRLAASLDQVSVHVLAGAVVEAAAARGGRLVLPQHVEEVPGQGIRGTVGTHRVAVGRAGWAAVTGLPGWVKTARRRARLDGALTVFVAVDGEPAGVLILNDPLRPDAAWTIRALRDGGIRRIVMVTGDRAEVAHAIGAVIGVDEVLAERTPADKLDAVRAKRDRAPVIMVGDGINDAPALALADVGVAMGARGATAASEAADAVLTVDRLDRLGEVRTLARRTRRIAMQSVLAGMGMSVAAMAVAAAGLLSAVWGALLQEAIDVAVILNALRVLIPATPHAGLTAADAALNSRFSREHLAIWTDIDQLRIAADALGVVAPHEAMYGVKLAYQLLVNEVGPHEKAEQEQLYPVMNRLLGSSHATATMSRTHAEIAHQTRRLGQLIDDIGAAEPDAADIADLRALLYGLHAILSLHTAQEDESYLSLGDTQSAEGQPSAQWGATAGSKAC
jgi:cation transport ATPase